MEKINKEYPILSNWKFVFKEMYDLDHKYPWYIAVRSVAGFLAAVYCSDYTKCGDQYGRKKGRFFDFFWSNAGVCAGKYDYGDRIDKV